MSKNWFFVFIIMPFLLKAQSILVHTDKPFYVTGETIWFKVYMSGHQNTASGAIKTLITDATGMIKDYFFLRPDGASNVHGRFIIPLDFTSGIYPIHFLARDSTNGQVIKLCTTEIPIYNDFEKNNTELLNPSSRQDTSVLTSTHTITIERPGTVSPREKTSLKLKITDRQGKPVKAHLSISITDKKLIADGRIPGANTFSTNIRFGTKLFYTFHFPDTSKAGSQQIIGIFSPSDWKINYASTRSNSISMLFEPFPANKEYQLINHQDRPKSILQENKFMYTPSSRLMYTESIIKYLQWSIIRKKIYQLYLSTESPIAFTPIAENRKKTTIPEPDRILQTTKYETLENLATLFREVNTPLTFRLNAKTNTYKANLYDPATFKVYDGSPLFMVDDKIVTDENSIAKMKMSQVESIDLYYDFRKIYYHLQLLGKNGLIHIHTKSKKGVQGIDPVNVYNLSGIQSPSVYPFIGEKEINSAQPILRPMIYWNPSLQTNEAGEAVITYYQPDDLSTFNIFVLAQDDQGNLSHQNATYTIHSKDK